MAGAADDLVNKAKNVIRSGYYETMDYLERAARREDNGPVDANTQAARDAWDAKMKEIRGGSDASIDLKVPKKDSGMNGVRG